MFRFSSTFPAQGLIKDIFNDFTYVKPGLCDSHQLKRGKGDKALKDLSLGYAGVSNDVRMSIRRDLIRIAQAMLCIDDQCSDQWDAINAFISEIDNTKGVPSAKQMKDLMLSTGLLRHFHFLSELANLLINTENQSNANEDITLDFIDDNSMIVLAHSDSYKRGDNYGPFRIIYFGQDFEDQVKL